MSDVLVGERPTIILCEPYEAIQEGLELVLGMSYQLTNLCRLDQIFPLLEEPAPNLLIVDVDDQPNAYTTLQAVRRAWKSLRILLLSNFFTLGQQTEVIRRVGSVSFLTKPFDRDILREKVQTLIQGYSSSPVRSRVVRITL